MLLACIYVLLKREAVDLGLNSLSRLALLTTVMEESAMAAPATTGLSKNPNIG